MKHTLVLTHIAADFDAAASCYAASLLYENSLPVLPGSPNKNVREFLSLHSNVIRFYTEKEVDFENVEKVVLTDIQSIERAGMIEEKLRRKNLPLIIYDHHFTTVRSIKNAELHLENIGATTTLLIEKIREKNISITPAEATLFALGIHEDTGSLTFKNTSPRDASALAWLYEKGAQPDLIHRFLHSRFTRDQTDLLISLINNGKLLRIRHKNIFVSSAESNTFIDGASAVLHRLVDIFNPDFALIALKTGSKLTLIARSSDARLDALKVLKDFNPSGHPEAAVAYAEHKDAQEVLKQSLNTVKDMLGPEIKIRDIMSRSVITVNPSTKISKVLELVKTTGHSGFPVVDKETIVGIITRREAEKAALHNLTHAPVKGFMARSPITIDAEATLEDAIKTMTEEGVGRLPVVQAGRLVGIVTRTDILKALHGSQYYSRQQTDFKNILLERYQQKIPERVRDILQLTGYIAEELGYKAYLVGGIVRDLILGYENPDYDVVIEGSAIEVAKKLVSSAGGRIDAYERFDTAVVIFSDDLRVDFATARTEYYEKPGSLPKVKKAGIKSDLLRRDFTINALAMSLSRRDFGEIIDVVGGLKDLQKGVIRVLHSLSFIEDPTRIIRAIRFESKFGFRMDPATEALSKEAVQRGALLEATRIRLRDEIFDLLREDNFLRAIFRAHELKIWQQLFPGFRLTQKKKSLLIRLAQNPPEDTEIKRLASLGALLCDFSPDVIAARCEEYRLKAKETRIIIEIVELLRKEKESFEKPSAIYNYLSRYREESLLAVRSLLFKTSPFKKQLNLYLNKLSKIKPAVTGKDLLEIGYEESPELGKVKQRLFELYLDGKLSTKEEMISYARELLAEKSKKEKEKEKHR